MCLRHHEPGAVTGQVLQELELRHKASPVETSSETLPGGAAMGALLHKLHGAHLEGDAWEEPWRSRCGESPGQATFSGASLEEASGRYITSSSPIRAQLPPAAPWEFAFKADGPILDSPVRPSSASDVLEALGRVACQVVRSLVVSIAAGPWEPPISHAPTQDSSSGWAGGLTALGAWMTLPESGKNNPTAALLESECWGTAPHLAAGNCSSRDVP